MPKFCENSKTCFSNASELLELPDSHFIQKMSTKKPAKFAGSEIFA